MDHLEQLIFALTAPIVGHRGWEDQITEELKQDIRLARLAQVIKKEWEEGLATEEEALAYVMTASLAAPFSREWYDIYVWLFNRYCERKKIELPEDLKSERELDGMEKDLLRDLRAWIRKQQLKAWRGRRKRERTKEAPKAEQRRLTGF